MATRYTIKYVYGSYNGTRTITLFDGDERDPIAVMWQELRPHMTLGMAAQGAKIVNQEHLEEEDGTIIDRPKPHRAFCACDRCLQRRYGAWNN